MYLYIYFACICIFILDGGVVGYLAEIATRSPLGMASPGAQNPGFWEKSNLVMLVMW